MRKMVVTDGKIVRRKQLNDLIYSIKIKLGRKLPSYSPGNFVMVSLESTGIDPLLPRPFSIFGMSGSEIELIFRKVGKGTGMLAENSVPIPVRVWGPLGNAFPKIKGRNLLVAGGLGLVPVYHLRRHINFEKVFVGFKNKNESFLVKDLIKNKNTVISTDDGSLYNKGFITKPLEAYLKEDAGSSAFNLYTCGPLPFLKKMREIADRFNVKNIYGSLETRMACGFGVCLGCVVETPGGMVKVCKDGPVFDLREVFGR